MIALEAWWNPLSWSAPFPVVVAALFGVVVLRAAATYALGRAVAAGSRRLPRAASLLERPGFARSVDRLNRWGAPAVSLSFLTVGVQTMVNFAAGALRMPLSRYLPALVVGSLLWALVYASVGFVGIGSVVLLWQRSPALAVLLGLALLGAFAGWVLWQARRGPATAGRDGEPPGTS